MKLRTYCEKEGISVIGTVGLLKAAHNKKYFVDDNVYDKLIHSVAKDLYLSEELIEWALKK